MRKRIIKLCLLLPAVAVFSSCSYSVYFVVVNKSGAPLEVQYKLKESRAHEGTYRLYTKPAKKATDDLEDFDVEWRELPSESIAFDEKIGLIRVMVQPGEALRVEAAGGPYSPYDAEDAKYFSLEGSRLSGANGLMQYNGEQARRQFEELSRQIYTVTYY